METLIQLQRGSKSFGAKTLFEAATFAVNETEHIGVIGPNGAGKSTLFRVLIGEEELDSGDVTRARGLRLGYLSQHDDWEADSTIEQFVSQGAQLPIWELKALGRTLGFSDSDYARPIGSFSGGFRMRAKLLRLIGSDPNLMLLDEPTNYLDLETLMVLEKFFQNYQGAFLVISHDREFLARTTDHVLEIEGGEITKFNGGIEDYFEQKELLRQQLEARALSVEQKRKEILDFVARFGVKATKASQAQSRLKALERMETVSVKALPVTAKIRIPPPSRVGKTILKLDRVSLGYGDRVVLRDVTLQLMGGDHLGVVGLNGAGKSTLLKALSGRIAPFQGTLETGYEVSVAFFNQHVSEELNPDDTVLRALQQKAHAAVLPQDILDLAGALLFSGDDVHKPIRVLSGGERSRVALGQVLLQKASCLILDEPTNHLDFTTVEALTQALQAFSGALVVVSHDRSFIRRIATRILEVNNGATSFYPGTYDDYVWSVEKGAFATLRAARTSESPSSESSASSELAKDEKERAGFNYKEQKKSLDRKLRQLDSKLGEFDRELSHAHQALTKLNQELSTGTNDPLKIKEMGELQKKVESLEAQWLQSAEEKEAVQRDIDALVSDHRN